jgi:hypothetical protein
LVLSGAAFATLSAPIISPEYERQPERIAPVTRRRDDMMKCQPALSAISGNSSQEHARI